MTSPKRLGCTQPSSKHSRVAPWPLALAAGALWLLSYCGELQPDEFECEHAVAHLLDCCPELVVDDDDCQLNESGCSSSATYPILNEQDAICVQELSCAGIHARGLCEAVQVRSTELPSERQTVSLCY